MLRSRPRSRVRRCRLWAGDGPVPTRFTYPRSLIPTPASLFREAPAVAPDPMHQIAQAIEAHGMRIERQHGRNGALRQLDLAASILEIASVGGAATHRQDVEAPPAAAAQRPEAGA